MQRRKWIFGVYIFFLVFTIFAYQGPVTANAKSTMVAQGDLLPAPLEPQLSKDEKTLRYGTPLKAVIKDPSPSEGPRRIPAPAWMKDLPEEAAASTITITYVPNGGTDLWDEPCYTFPQAAKDVFEAAARIWENTLKSSVPITISACWADLGSSSTLGYSGGGNQYRNFSGAPRANTWYVESLANALHGSDLGPSDFDMHITYNQNFTWYYGTDGNTPVDQMDLMTVVLHEICHGLNFSGLAEYASGLGKIGYGSGNPNIYDVFMKDGAGTLLIDYPDALAVGGSTALGSALTSNDLWFHGSKAMAANGGPRVKMYAPSAWSGGSSYSHLDYSTFNDTPNELMVYAVSSGESVHDPGVITNGLLQDLGWQPAGTTPPPPPCCPPPLTAVTALLLDEEGTTPPPPPPVCTDIPNGDFESGAVSWTEYSSHGWDIIGEWGAVSAHSGTWYAWLGGDYGDTSYMDQFLTVPASCPYLVFYHYIASEDGCGFDNGYVRISAQAVETIQLCSTNNTGGWVKKSIDLSSYADQNVSIQFRVVTDGSLNSNWFIDDVSFQASASEGLVAEPVQLKVDSAAQTKIKKALMKGR